MGADPGPSCGLDRGNALCRLYVMATTTIALTQSAYERLKRQKLPGESFSDVVLREVPEPLETAGEVLDYFESHPVPKSNPQLRAAMLSGRSRRSNRRLIRARKFS